MHPVTPRVKSNRWPVWCWGPWEMDGRTKLSPWLLSSCCSGVIVERQSKRECLHLWGTWGLWLGDKKGPAPLCQLPKAPFAEMINGIFHVFNMFPEKCSARQRGVFINYRRIQGEISIPHTAVTQVGNNSEKSNLTGLSLCIILWLSEIKCNFDCLISVTHYFFLTWIKIPAQGFRNMSLWVDWNYLDLKDIFLFEEQNFIKLIKKNKIILQILPPARKAGYLCIPVCGWEDGPVPPVLYHAAWSTCCRTWCGRGCAGPQPCPPQHTVKRMARPLHEPLPMPGKLEQICLVGIWGFLLYRNKIRSSSVLFSHTSFDPSHKYLTERTHG